MADVQLDVSLFWQRAKHLYSAWSRHAELWNRATAIAFASGAYDENNIYGKVAAFQLWLLGFEFPKTVMVFLEDQIVFVVANKRSAGMLAALQSENAFKTLQILMWKKESPNTEIWSKLADLMAGAALGTIAKADGQGPQFEQWKAFLSDKAIATVDVTNALAEDVFAVKDEPARRAMKQSAAAAGVILQNYLRRRIEDCVDEEVQITHAALSEEAEAVFASPERVSGFRDLKLDPAILDYCYTPIVQSGGEYDLKPAAISSSSQLSYDTVVSRVGARYANYCSTVARTYFFDPTRGQRSAYRALCSLRDALLKRIIPDVVSRRLPAREVMLQARELMKRKHPDLLPCMPRSLGSGIGLEFRETRYLLNDKNTNILLPGMVLNLTVALQDVPVKKGSSKTVAMMLGDTVLLEDGVCTVLTPPAAADVDDVIYEISGDDDGEKADDDDDEEDVSGASVKAEKGKGKRGATAEQRRVDKAAERALAQREAAERRREHQRELAKQKHEEATKRFAREAVSNLNISRVARNSKDIQSYRDVGQFPSGAVNTQIHVDVKNQSVLVPIGGSLVPFHISTIHNVTKLDEGDFVYMRIRFHTPNPSGSLNRASNDVIPADLDPRLAFVRELSYRCADPDVFNRLHRLILELRKRVNSMNAERKEKESLVVQEDLILRSNGPKLNDVTLRPAISRKSLGSLSAHRNGFRFSTLKSEKVDILFKNIKAAFFQPAENEINVIIHFHLHHPIMLGKKKTRDLQVVTEVMETSQALDSSRRGMDRDELEDEQRERMLRTRLNKEFEGFVHRCEEHIRRETKDKVNIEFEIPYRNLGFFGVPERTNVWMMPTLNFLCSLSDPPFFVLSLDEVEIVHMERVNFGLRHFDMVVIMKDLTTFHTVKSIPMESLDAIKDWLDSLEILHYEGSANFNWKRLLKTINDDRAKFFEDGGWSFLAPESDNEAGGEDEESAEEESDFAPSDVESESSEDDYSSEEEESDESEGDEDDDDDDGEDWDELERKAADEDRQAESGKKRGRDDAGDHGSTHKKKHKSKH